MLDSKTMSSYDQKDELRYSNERKESCFVKDLNITVYKKNYKQIKTNPQPSFIYHTSRLYRFKKQKNVRRHSSLHKRNDCRKSCKSYAVNKENKYKSNLFQSKWVVNMVFERPFNRALGPFNNPNKSICNIYRCQVTGPDNKCCCSCDSDAIFQVMKGLYSCYKKKNCLNCSCILCGDQKLQDEMRTNNDRPSEKFASLLTRSKRKSEAKRKSRQSATHGIPPQGDQTQSKIDFPGLALNLFGKPSRKSVIPLDKKTSTKEVLIKVKEPVDTLQDAKLAKDLTPSHRKYLKHREKLLRSLVKNDLPLPVGRTESEKKLIETVRNNLGLPPDPETLPEIEDKALMNASNTTILEGKPPNKMNNAISAGDPIPEGETLLKKDLMNRLVDHSISKHKIVLEKMRHRQSSGLLTPLQGKSPEQKEKILKDLVTAGLPLPEPRTVSEKYLIDRIKNKPVLALKQNTSSVSTALETMTPTEKEIILKRLKDAGLPFPENNRKPKDLEVKIRTDRTAGIIKLLEGKTPEEKKKILHALIAAGTSADKSKKTSFDEMLPIKKPSQESPEKMHVIALKRSQLLKPLEGKSKAEKKKIVKSLVIAGVPLPEGKTPSEKSLIHTVKAEMGIPPVRKQSSHKSVILKARAEGLFSTITGKPHAEKVRILKGLAKYSLPLPEGKTLSEKELIKKIKNDSNWLTKMMRFKNGRSKKKSYETKNKPRMRLSQNYQAVINTTMCERGCGCDKRKIKFKDNHTEFRMDFPNVPDFCGCPGECNPGGKRGYFVDSKGIKIIVGSAAGAPSILRENINQIMQNGLSSKPYSCDVDRAYSKCFNVSKSICFINDPCNSCGNGSSKTPCYRRAKKCVGLKVHKKHLQKTARNEKNVRRLKSESKSGSSVSILVINSETSLSLGTSGSNSMETISVTCSEEFINQYEDKKKKNICAINPQLEYAVFRLSEEKNRFVNKSTNFTRPRGVTGNIIVINRFSKKINISKLLDKVLARKRFTEASSLFVVVPTSDKECIKVVDSTSACSMDTPLVAKSDTMTATSPIHEPQVCGKGKKFYMQEVLSTTRDTEKAVQKDSLRVLKYVNMKMRNKCYKRPKWCRYSNMDKIFKTNTPALPLVPCISSHGRSSIRRRCKRKYRRPSSVSINERLNKYNYIPKPCQCNSTGFDLGSYQAAKVTVDRSYSGSLDNMRRRRSLNRCSRRKARRRQSSSSSCSSTSDEREKNNKTTKRSVRIAEGGINSIKQGIKGVISKSGIPKAIQESISSTLERRGIIKKKKRVCDSMEDLCKPINERMSCSETSSDESESSDDSDVCEKPCPRRETQCSKKKIICTKPIKRKCGCAVIEGNGCACIEHYRYGGPRPGPTPWTWSRGMATDLRGPAIIHARKICEYRRVLCGKNIDSCCCLIKEHNCCNSTKFYVTCPCGEHSHPISYPDGCCPKKPFHNVGTVTDVMGSDIFRLELRFCPADPTDDTKKKKKCKKYKGCVCKDLVDKGAVPKPPKCSDDCTRIPKPVKKKKCINKLKNSDPCWELAKLQNIINEPRKNVCCQTEPCVTARISKFFANMGKSLSRRKASVPCYPSDEVVAIAPSARESVSKTGSEPHVWKNPIFCKCEPLCKCVECKSLNPKRPEGSEVKYSPPCTPKKMCECKPFCQCLACTLSMSKPPECSCECKPSSQTYIPAQRGICVCNPNCASCECMQCFCRKYTKCKKKSVTLIDPKEAPPSCAPEEPAPEPKPVPEPEPEPEPKPELEPRIQIVELPPEYLPEGQVYETIGPSCAWIKDTEALLKIRSELTLTSSGFKASKTKRLPPKPPEPEIELDFAQAIRYFAMLNPDRFRELMIQERYRRAQEEKKRQEYLDEMKQELERLEKEAQKRKEYEDKILRYLERILGKRLLGVLKKIKDSFTANEEKELDNIQDIIPLEDVVYTDRAAEADLDPEFWYPEGFKLTIGVFGGATPGNPNPSCR
ncbi:hypothetical protein HF086_002632 [Spodoptera exigua]|uniref:Uncharacterized protein n=1 Tax=Spodoptera exigua TaxID=7107 RepID=A0A922M8C2_SPOEX|nr:hypothetical protein HF086_002632 [Spodoptera exigua]